MRRNFYKTGSYFLYLMNYKDMRCDLEEGRGAKTLPQIVFICNTDAIIYLRRKRRRRWFATYRVLIFVKKRTGRHGVYPEATSCTRTAASHGFIVDLRYILIAISSGISIERDAHARACARQYFSLRISNRKKNDPERATIASCSQKLSTNVQRNTRAG